MSIYALIFSNERSFRIGRHVLFWSTWILYYTIFLAIDFAPSFGITRSFFGAFTETALSTPLDMCFCYFIIYFLLPEFLFKGRYLSMVMLWMVASIIFIVLFELNSFYILPIIRGWFGLPVPMRPKTYLWEVFSLFSQINMEGCVAASIKLGKLWYIKQQEIDLLKQEKEKIEPHEEQGLMHPAFLNDLLSRIEHLADTKPVIVAQSIKKIRSLLTYMLYENAQAKILLSNEIELVKDYVQLEKMIANEDLQVNIHTDVEAEASEKIAPFILLPLVENAFRQIYIQPMQNKWIDINIKMHQGVLNALLCWNKPLETSAISNGRNIILQNISKKLQLIYPQSHELKLKIEVEKVLVDVTIDLKKAII